MSGLDVTTPIGAFAFKDRKTAEAFVKVLEVEAPQGRIRYGNMTWDIPPNLNLLAEIIPLEQPIGDFTVKVEVSLKVK